MFERRDPAAVPYTGVGRCRDRKPAAAHKIRSSRDAAPETCPGKTGNIAEDRGPYLPLTRIVKRSERLGLGR